MPQNPHFWQIRPEVGHPLLILIYFDLLRWDLRARGFSGIAFHVAIEARLAAAFPVAVVVIINSWSGAQEAEELVLGRTDDNPDVAVPDNQIRGFRVRHPLKTFGPVI